MNNKEGRILLVAYSYPPLQDPQSIRWFNFSNLLAQKGYKIDVITIKLPDSLIKSNKFRLHSNITVFRIFPGPLENIAYNLKAKIGTDEVGNLLKRQKRRFRLLKTGYWSIRKIMNNILIGGLRTEWLPFCLNFLKSIDISKYSVLITSQEPFVDSLIGLSIKKKNPDLRWIADMGDILLSPYYPKWRQKADIHVEKRIMKNTDRVILTNKNALKLVSKRYDMETDKFAIITQGFSPYAADSHKKHKNMRFTLFFAGSFYKGFREPDSLIEALSAVDANIKFVIAGTNEFFMDRFEAIADKIEFLGLVPYFESLKLQRKADILVNISNKQLYQVPGKFFEYLGSGRPILDIVYDENDETAKLTREFNVGVVCRNSACEIRDAILRLYNLWKNDMLENSFDLNNAKPAKYSWESGAEKLCRLIEGRTTEDSETTKRADEIASSLRSSQ